MSSNNFNPEKDIPDLSGKVIFITGGTAGLGQGSIVSLAKHNPAHIFFSGRNTSSADALIANVNQDSPDVALTFIPCDLSSFASVQAAAKTFQASSDRLDILMCNAGIMAVPASVSKDGYEIQFATNHLGHALLIQLLLPTLLATARQPASDVRIVNLTSIAYEQAPAEGIVFASLNTAQEHVGRLIPGRRWSRYGQSKLANMLYAQELAKHYPSLTSVAVHPGVIHTALFDSVSLATKLMVLISCIGQMTAVAEGPWAQLWAATCDRSSLTNGAYYVPIGQVGAKTTAAARSSQLAEELWDWTQTELERGLARLDTSHASEARTEKLGEFGSVAATEDSRLAKL